MSAPIGVFDSGVGGLTVLRELNERLPLESTLYLGDNARFPYGPRPPRVIRRFALECLDYLMDQGAKALVIACNTATSASLDAARARYGVPVLGAIHVTARLAARVAVKRVGVIGTVATVNSGLYERYITEINSGLEVHQKATPLLASMVEEAELATSRARTVVGGYLQPLRQRMVDTLVLGCTHYPLLRPVIDEVMGPEVRIVESGQAVVEALVELMDRGQVARASGGAPVRRMLTTGDGGKFHRVASILWPRDLPEIEIATIGGTAVHPARRVA